MSGPSARVSCELLRDAAGLSAEAFAAFVKALLWACERRTGPRIPEDWETTLETWLELFRAGFVERGEDSVQRIAQAAWDRYRGRTEAQDALARKRQARFRAARRKPARAKPHHQEATHQPAPAPALDPKVQAALDRILADETLAPITKNPAKVAQDLVAVAPALDVPTHISMAGAWLRANPRAKKANGARFLVNWLSKDQERARVPKAAISQPRRNGALRSSSEAEHLADAETNGAHVFRMEG